MTQEQGASAKADRACAPTGLSRDESQAEPLVPSAMETMALRALSNVEKRALTTCRAMSTETVFRLVLMRFVHTWSNYPGYLVYQLNLTDAGVRIAQAIEARSGETAQPVRSAGRKRGPQDAP